MITVPHRMVGLERMLDYRGVRLARFHCTTEGLLVVEYGKFIYVFLCLGYIWQKFSEAEVALLDDQRVFNMILLGYGMKWETSHSIYNSTFGQTHNGIRAVALDASYSYRGNVSTEMEGIDTDKLVILHPFLGRDLKRKINTLHKMNLWQLRVSEDEFFALLKDDNAGSGEQWFGRICKKKGQLQVSFDGVKRTVLV